MALQRSALAALVVFGCSSPVVPGEFDYDNDGFVTSRDCDDMNSAIFPGADEFCDGVDSDCDGVIDNDPVDGLIAFVDADGDGVGVAETLQRVCELDAGLSQTTGDCNDNDATIFPGSPEICDLIDNDCDGKADLNRVPTDYATIEQAMDALPTNSEICLQSSLTEA
ncbi:MAG: putative metal-binding motif-containing protein [Myxococcota bacterium]